MPSAVTRDYRPSPNGHFVGELSEGRLTAAARMPQREDLDGRLWFLDNPIVQVVSDPSEMHAPDSGECRIAGEGAEVWLQDKERRRPRKVVAERIRCLRTIGAPPIIRDTNLFRRQLADDDGKRSAQSSLRRSEKTLSSGTVRPLSH